MGLDRIRVFIFSSWAWALVLSAFALCSTMAPQCAMAHRINVFAYFEGKNIVAEGYFSKESKAKDCPIFLHDSQGNKLFEGKTDDQGAIVIQASELAPIRGDIIVTVQTPDGHKATYTLPMEDAPRSLRASTGQKRSEDHNSGQSGTISATGAKDFPESDFSPHSDAQLEAMIRNIVQQENAKTIKMISNLQRRLLEAENPGPSLRDIVGGLGWIMGLAGIAAYFHGRRMNR
jgi:nickel transport protein